MSSSFSQRVRQKIFLTIPLLIFYFQKNDREICLGSKK